MLKGKSHDCKLCLAIIQQRCRHPQAINKSSSQEELQKKEVVILLFNE
jgi:hypothetical protein